MFKKLKRHGEKQARKRLRSEKMEIFDILDDEDAANAALRACFPDLDATHDGAVQLALLHCSAFSENDDHFLLVLRSKMVALKAFGGAGPGHCQGAAVYHGRERARVNLCAPLRRIEQNILRFAARGSISTRHLCNAHLPK